MIFFIIAFVAVSCSIGIQKTDNKVVALFLDAYFLILNRIKETTNLTFMRQFVFLSVIHGLHTDFINIEAIRDFEYKFAAAEDRADIDCRHICLPKKQWKEKKNEE
ncbi:MAG: hypothetical protein LBQ64_06500 [Bacteroidales bacterium]|nr:hypothetical protein [Bacteroidales bacterium]